MNWRPIIGFEGLYEISDTGLVRSVDRFVNHYAGGQRLLKGKPKLPFVTAFGYKMIMLSKNGINKSFQVHRLVLASFTENKGKGFDCCHNDGNRTNNNLSNLRWDTRTGNMQDTVKHGTRRNGENVNFAKLSATQIQAIKIDTRSQRDIAQSYGVHQSAISLIKRNKRWKHIQ